MQQRPALTERDINRDLLRPVLATPIWFYFLLGGLAIGVCAAIGGFAWAINHGTGVYGINRPVMWGFLLVNFVFWVGISHAGVMLSAILRLSNAEWRRPATRAAEVLTIFALGTAALHPLFHTGRPWRIYWSMPPGYDLGRGIWPDIRSPFVWDPTAISTYLTGTTLFVMLLLIPDLAVLRDRSSGVMHKVYGFMSMGWRGNTRQWKLQIIAGFLLSALILPVFVSVHSIVSWDFAVQIAVEGWNATIFAPYFVIGAVHSGVAGVISILALLRWMFRWENYIRDDHFDALARLMIVVATAWFYFFVIEFLLGIYPNEEPELSLRTLQVFEWPFSGTFIVFVLMAYVVPVPLWLFKKVRQNVALMFWTTIMVNIGMWLERFIIIIPGLMRKQPLTFNWGSYNPSPIELLLVGGSFCLVFLGVLTFSKFFPIIPLADAKEGIALETHIRVGKVMVPAAYREE